ncbi:MAG: Ig-like domain-containing protein [Chthoniobacteraceae bacterium]
MKNALPRVLPAILLAALIQTVTSAPPIPAPENYSTAEDAALIVPAGTGVLVNDDPNGNPEIEAVLATPPAHGTVSLNPDGSFTFTPAANYAGADSFTYKARNVVPPLPFDINPALSNSTISVRVHGPLGINQERNDTSRLDGTATVGVLEPRTTGPFNLIQVTGLNAVLIDDIALHYNFGFFIGTADITAAPGAITVTMDAPGPAAPVNGAGQFTQTGNTLAGEGIVHVKYDTTFAGNSESDQSLNHATATSDLTNATIVSNGTTMTLTLPIDFTRNGVVVDAANNITADIHIFGTIVATAPASLNVAEESAASTVGLTVTPVNDPPVAVAESYIARESTAMTIAATAAQSTEELVSAGSVWKYRYNGQNLGTAWKDWLHNDSAWASGPAQLGFGDPEILTNIRPGATPNYITAYFRRAFTITNLSNTRPGVRLYVKRDDAAALYLNGVEVYRDTELPAGAAFDTYATASRPDAEENVFVEVTLSRSLLFEGVNVLAAEVHQVSPTSSDLRFDARLTRELGAPGVLANDTDIDSPPASLAASVLAQPAHGQLSLSVNGGFIYTPTAGYIGADSFAYRVSDGGTPDSTPLTLLPRGSSWRYLADGTDQTQLWRASAFDDSLWPAGLAELGYGDTADGRPEATNIRPDPVNTPIYATYYFRAHFTAPTDLTFVTNVRGRILRDDAAAIYINGAQVFRDTHLAADALFSDFSGGTPSETDYAEFPIPASALIAGDNVIAVEVHQSGPTSSDVSFDFELVADVVPGARVSINVLNDDADLDGMSDTWERANGLNYLSAADAATDADGDGRSNRSEFLAGTNPNNPTQYLRATSITRSGGDLIVGFTGTLAGRTYQLESSPDLVVWTNNSGVLTATGPALTLAIPFGAGGYRFHRLRALFTFP